MNFSKKSFSPNNFLTNITSFFPLLIYDARQHGLFWVFKRSSREDKTNRAGYWFRKPEERSVHSRPRTPSSHTEVWTGEGTLASHHMFHAHQDLLRSPSHPAWSREQSSSAVSTTDTAAPQLGRKPNSRCCLFLPQHRAPWERSTLGRGVDFNQTHDVTRKHSRGAQTFSTSVCYVSFQKPVSNVTVYLRAWW